MINFSNLQKTQFLSFDNGNFR